VLLGAAVAVKLYPALVLVAAVRRRGVLVVGTVAAVVVGSYVPHVLAVGGHVVGYLPGYLREEGYDTGTRFALLSAVLPTGWATAVAVAVVAAAAVVALRSADPDRPWDAALPFLGVVFLVSTPYQGWYGLLLVGLVPLARAPQWLAVAAAGFPLYAVAFDERLAAARASYGLALLVVLTACWRDRVTRRRSLGGPEGRSSGGRLTARRRSPLGRLRPAARPGDAGPAPPVRRTTRHCTAAGRVSPAAGWRRPPRRRP